MLSPKKVVQPNPSYPAVCRQDTASSWSTDYGGNIYGKTVILMPATKEIERKTRRKKEETFYSTKKH